MISDFKLKKQKYTFPKVFEDPCILSQSTLHPFKTFYTRTKIFGIFRFGIFFVRIWSQMHLGRPQLFMFFYMLSVYLLGHTFAIHLFIMSTPSQYTSLIYLYNIIIIFTSFFPQHTISNPVSKRRATIFSN